MDVGKWMLESPFFSSMTNEEWNKLDRKALATIKRYLAKNVYFNVSGEKTT